ncbi:MAG TPA: WXG100 family type VII secretion target [Pseudonocardiaceae bacterium]
MSGYTTDSATMQQAANDVANINGEIQGQLQTLLNQIAPLESAWKGEASKAFHQLIERWQNDARKLNDALMAISEQLGGASQTYLQQEEEQAAAMNSIAAGLEG